MICHLRSKSITLVIVAPEADPHAIDDIPDDDAVVADMQNLKLQENPSKEGGAIPDMDEIPDMEEDDLEGDSGNVVAKTAKSVLLHFKTRSAKYVIQTRRCRK